MAALPAQCWQRRRHVHKRGHRGTARTKPAAGLVSHLRGRAAGCAAPWQGPQGQGGALQQRTAAGGAGAGGGGAQAASVAFHTLGGHQPQHGLL
ncbi:hypothetical protein HaLaN_14430, partial [Haematococcus lacustris]